MKKIHFLLLGLAVALFGVGCAGDGDTGPNPTVRVIHASPNAGNVDLRVNSSIVATNVAYGSAFPATPAAPATVNAGVTNLAVLATGTSTVALSASPNLRHDRIYTVLAAGSATDSTNALRLITLEDRRDDLSASQANLRVVHASLLAPAVDVYVTTTTADITSLSPNISNLPRFGNFPLVQLEPGTYRIRVTPTGTKTVAIDATVTLSANTYGAVVARDDDGDPILSTYLGAF